MLHQPVTRHNTARICLNACLTEMLGVLFVCLNITGWEFATGGGMDATEEAAEQQEPLTIVSDSVRRYLQNVPDQFYQSVRSDTHCILMLSNFSPQHVMEVYWCNRSEARSVGKE